MSRQSVQAFTLIETVLFISISAIVTMAIFSVVWNVLEVSNESERFQAAQLEFVRVSERMNFLIRNADSVEAITDSSLTIGVANSSETVTFSLEDGALQVNQGGEKKRLTGSSVSISGLHFSDFVLSNPSIHFIQYEIYGSTGVSADNFPVYIRSGAESRSITGT